MPRTETRNRRYVLAERPVGAPDARTLRLEETDLPEAGPGEMLLRNEYLSLDPYMRGRMSDAPSYAAPVEIGEVMIGGTVSRVMSSNVKGFAEGDLVSAFGGWQDYAVSDGAGVVNLGADPEHPSWALGVLGMPGLTAYAGLTRIGRPEAGETLVVGAASGPVGATVGQIARILGCRAVGIAGGPEKCTHVVDGLGFDACVDYRVEGFADALRAAAPDGVDIYWENVGGAVQAAVWPLLNPLARIPVCGLISHYNETSLPEGPDRSALLMGSVLRKRLTMRGFIVFDDFGHLYPEFVEKMTEWIEAGEILYREEMIDGLEAAPDAFRGLLAGEAFGKRVIRLGA